MYLCMYGLLIFFLVKFYDFILTEELTGLPYLYNYSEIKVGSGRMEIKKPNSECRNKKY